MHTHPFYDGNGRTARILSHIALIENGFPEELCPLVMLTTQVYRLQHYQVLRKCNQAGEAAESCRFFLNKTIQLLLRYQLFLEVRARGGGWLNKKITWQSLLSLPKDFL